MSPLKAYEVVARHLGPNVAGECYAASEAIYHMAGGKDAGLTPMVISWTRPSDGARMTHWFLRWGGSALDVTAAQFTPADAVPYDRARGCGFLTKSPSRRAAKIMMEAVQCRDLAYGRKEEA